IVGWHVFRDDPLTGRHTLVCDVEGSSREALCKVQRRAREAAAPVRDPIASRERYQSSWSRLSQQERANVEAWGFPFLGSGWHPHVTIASIESSAWKRVWRALADDPPRTCACFPYLTLYAVSANRPMLLERFALEKPTCTE